MYLQRQKKGALFSNTPPAHMRVSKDGKDRSKPKNKCPFSESEMISLVIISNVASKAHRTEDLLIFANVRVCKMLLASKITILIKRSLRDAVPLSFSDC